MKNEVPMLARLQRLFANVPPERVSDEVAFSGRLVVKINDYLRNRQPIFMPDAGEERAKQYKKEIFSERYRNEQGDSLDAKLLLKVFNDICRPYGEPPLYTSVKLRWALVLALCEHLHLDDEALRRVLDAERDHFVAAGIGTKLGLIENQMIGSMRNFLLVGMIHAGLVLLYDPEQGFEMKTFTR